MPDVLLGEKGGARALLAHLSAQAVACLLYILLAHTVGLRHGRVQAQLRMITASVADLSNSIVIKLAVLGISTVRLAEGF
jgi:hypothetical protein